MEADWYSLGIVLLTGMLGIWKAVPVGFVLDVNPVLIFILTSTGAALAIIILYLLGNPIRKYILVRLGKRKSFTKKNERAARLLEKYGTPGLGLLGCLLMGPNMTLLVGFLVVSNPKKLLPFIFAGIIIWTFGLTLLGSISLDILTKLTT